MRLPYKLSSFLGKIPEEARAEAFFLALVTIAVLIVPFLPLEFVNNGPSLCIFKIVFGHPCPGCGMTRAFWALLHGDVVSAIGFNWKIIFVAPILGALYFYRVSFLAKFSPFSFHQNYKMKGRGLLLEKPSEFPIP